MNSISDLPLDLESDILARVPPMSLAKLRITCKRWYALFNDPKFVKMNNLAKPSKEEVMLLMKFRAYSISLNLHGIHNGVGPPMEFTRALSRREDSIDLEISEIFHCDGLVLCSGSYTIESGRRLVVWNPCTGETRSIEPKEIYLMHDKYALGYGNKEYSSCRSYKILRFWRYQLVEIYEFRSDSWRALDEIADKWVIHTSGLSLKGNTYWIASEYETGFRVLLSFDFTVERFVSFPLPCQIRSSDTVFLSLVREEKLAMLRQNKHPLPLEMTVWLSNKIDDAKEVSWSKFLVVNSDKLIQLRSFLVDEENKMVVYSSGFEQVFIVGENLHKEITKVSETVGHWSCCPRLLSYVPSLVRIPKRKQEENLVHIPKGQGKRRRIANRPGLSA